jgi:hypothetical protein
MNSNFNGNVFLEICQVYIDSLNNGELPNIDNAWFYVCKN